MRKRPAIIVDIDGTLANAAHRIHHIKKQPKDWQSFFDEAVKDEPFKWCVELVLAMARTHEILFVTGRGEEDREQTLNWLMENVPIWENSNTGLYCLNMNLFMRPAGSRDQDFDVKRRVYRERIQDKYDILFALEDRGRVTKMWRELGLTCLQCSDWEERDQETAKEAANFFEQKRSVS